MSLLGRECHDATVFPWNRDLWKALGLGQNHIELLDHVLSILELCILMEIAFHSCSTVGAMHGVKLIIAPHMTVLAESANAEFG